MATTSQSEVQTSHSSARPTPQPPRSDVGADKAVISAHHCELAAAGYRIISQADFVLDRELIYTSPGLLPGCLVKRATISRATDSPANAPFTTVVVKVVTFPLPDSEESLRPRLEKRLLREIVVWEKLEHQNIVPFLGYDVSHKRPVDSSQYLEGWLVSPWADWGNSRDYVEKQKPNSQDRLKLIRDAALGLQYLHGLNPPICHRDIKSLNVVITSTRRAQLCDFGIASILDDSDFDKLKTDTFDNKNTLRWASPEAVNEESGRPPSDMWSLGWFVWEIMTGRIPFEGLSLPKIVISITSGNLGGPEKAVEIAQIGGLADLLRRCWKMQPDDRISIGPFVQEVERMILPPQEAPPGSGIALQVVSSPSQLDHRV